MAAASFYAILQGQFIGKQRNSVSSHRSNYPLGFQLRRILDIFTVSCLTFLLVACASGNTTTPAASPQAHPTPTTLPSGTVLYQADWSHGLTGWQASPHWKIVGQYLQTDLSDNLSLTAPYMPTVPDYAVEFRLQVVSVPKDGGYFMLTADNVPGKNGYQARVLDLLDPNPHNAATHPLTEVAIDPFEDAKDNPNSETFDYEPGFGWRTYRVEVHAEQVFFFIDGTRVSRAASAKTKVLSNGPIRLICGKAILRVSNFRITSV